MSASGIDAHWGSSARDALHVHDLLGLHVDHAHWFEGIALQSLVIADAREEEFAFFGQLDFPDHAEHFFAIAQLEFAVLVGVWAYACPLPTCGR